MKKKAVKKAPARKRPAQKKTAAAPVPANPPGSGKQISITAEDRHNIAVIVAEMFNQQGLVMPAPRPESEVTGPRSGAMEVARPRPKPTLLEHIDTMDAQKERLGGIVVRLEMLADKACGQQPDGEDGANRTQGAGARGALEAVQIGHGILIERLDSALMRLEGFL